MVEPRQPYGTWSSPITAEIVARAGIRVSFPTFVEDEIWWLESRPAEQGRSVADVLRTAVIQYVEGRKQFTDSEARHLRISEYIQVAIDWIIQQDHSDMRDHLIAQTDLRMERYHGAR